MADLASEREAAIELMIEQYQRLQRHDPNHQLLRYLQNITDTSFQYSADECLLNEFFDTYAHNPKTPTAVMLTRYLVDLRNAADKIEGVTRSSPLPQLPQTTRKNLSEILPEVRDRRDTVEVLLDEEELPF